VWRVKWKVCNGSHFLVLGCMHGGCRVYRLGVVVDALSNQVSMVEEACVAHTDIHTNDKHLAYGIDALSLTPQSSEEASGAVTFKIASCSFYDNLIQVWTAAL
jgi:hypothetical protein